MSQCYSVYLHIKVKDENGAIKALQKKIGDAKKDNVSYREQYDRSTLEGLIKTFITDENYEMKSQDGFTNYSSGFNASYGWCFVMEEFFQILMRFCEEDSYFEIYPDEEPFRMVWDGSHLTYIDIKEDEKD